MFENISNKSRAYLTLVVFAAIAFAFWKYSDAFAAWTMTSNIWLVMVVSIVINPAYIFLIITLYHQYNWRGLLSGLIISIAIDIISLTHSILKAGVLPVDSTASPLYGYADTTFYKLMYDYIHGPTAVFILYVVIPTLLIYLALRIIRKTSSFNKIVKESI
jgi:hypothetical protein